MARRATTESAVGAGGPAQAGVDGLTTAERSVLQVTLVLSTLLFTSRALDSHATVKFTLIAVGTVAVTGIAVYSSLSAGVLRLRSGAGVGALLCFTATATVATVLSDDRWRSFVGQRGRASGLLTYLIVSLLFMLVATRASERDVNHIVIALLAAAAAVAVYGLAQSLGVVHLSVILGATFGPRAPISTLGNPNFVAGFLGTTFPLVLWLTWRSRRSFRWTVGGVVALVAVGWVLLATRSFQGVAAATVGSALPIGGLAYSLAVPAVRRRVMGGVAVVALVGVLFVAAGLAGHGPFGPQLDDVGREQRLEFWGAAARITRDHPIVGVGFDRFGSYYRAYRTSRAALQFGVTESADEPHSVPLGMFVGGGLLLGAAYIAFVVAVAAELVRGLRRRTGDARILLLFVGGAWVAYQVQSAVSIDVPPLPLVHMVLAASIVVLAREPRIVWQKGRARNTRSSRRLAIQAARSKQRRDWIIGAGVAIVSVAALWLALIPLRAELAGASALNASNANQAVDRMRHAHALVPREPFFAAEVGRILLEADEQALAMPYYAEATRDDPRSLVYVLPYARLLHAAGQNDEAGHWYEQALKIEPHAPEIKIEVGKFELSRRNGERALRLLDAALASKPGDFDARIARGDATFLLGDPERAAAEYLAAVSDARPDQLDLRNTLGQVLMRRGQYPAAVQVFADLTIDRSDRPEFWDGYGAALEKVGREADAVAAYRSALTLSPTDATAAEALRRLGGR